MITLAGMVWCVAAYVTAAALARRLVEWTRRRGMVDRPHRRRLHTRPTPRGGGLAIIAVAGLAAAVTAWQMPAQGGRISAAVLPAVAVALVGWWDDIAPRPVALRLAAQVAAAFAAIWLLRPAAGVAGVLWIVGVTNVFNFLDGSDGLAGLTGAVVAGCLAWAAAMTGDHAVAAIAAAAAASCLGFLTCNWEPARIFMGDVGSTGCGFLLAVLPLAATPRHQLILVFIVAATGWPLITDALVTLLSRLWRRENIFMAHRQHLYQRLVLAGWSHRAVATLYAGLAASGGSVAIAWLGRLR
jgi:UDP-N-acetylmuramyl pentapeptide phosphotransferase/UDP-N-acetylglucosamine-1-phosphate transferase